ncbi:site-specific integrase [Enterobacteriaceae bacterium H20N1]|uniref:Site-specific integrase n=1 Tax=Dryocola boscaweniae TaxID=2925397 RepID=A0A9X2W869_9ENTR|nr:site-specific integrase [Dryocola boscaweniae]MCT4702452.1 site-specific integrase [Dryocola boscaweniae]MCT4719620.1 site-specific integrase [Dryocola boscaweniae]
MAAIRKLPSGKWNAQVRIAGRKPISSTHPTKEKAAIWAKAQEQGHPSAHSPTPKKGRPRRNTIHRFALDYMSDVMERNGKRRGGYEATFFRLVVLERHFPDLLLEGFKRDHIIEYRNKRVKEVSGSTVRLELQLLSRFLRWCASEKGIECVDVVAGVKLPEPGKPRDKIIEPNEYEMILDRASEKAKPIIMIAWETAMRRNEILAIKPNMIDFRKKTISLQYDMTKNGEARDVPLSTAALELLQTLCDGRDKDQPLFTLTPYAVTQAFRRAARLAGVTDVCFHSIRHTVITRYADMGFTPFQLAVVSGHKTLAMLGRYTHLKASRIADLMG